MEALTIDIPIKKIGEPYHITVYSDLHLGSSHVNEERLIAHMNRRAALPNAIFVGLGDTCDYIVPTDMRRHLPSNNPEELARRDDYIDAAIDYQYERLHKYPWKMFGLGNHGFEMTRRHHVDPVRRLANKLGAHYAGFSGLARIRFRYPRERKAGSTQAGSRGILKLLYHHGGASGSVTKGLPWAKRWSACYEGWDVFVWGHNHQTQSHHETKFHMNGAGNIVRRSIYMVNCGTWLESYPEGGTPPYPERRGLPPVALASPLITVTPVSKAFGVNVSVTLGDE